MKLQKCLIYISLIIATLLLLVIFLLSMSAIVQNVLIGVFSSVLVAGLIAVVQYISIRQLVVDNVEKTTFKICTQLVAIKLVKESLGSSKLILELTRRAEKLCKEFDSDCYIPIIPQWSKVRHSIFNLETIYRKDIVVSLEINIAKLVKNASISSKESSFTDDKLELDNQIDMIINDINRNMMIICGDRWSRQFTKITEHYSNEEFESTWNGAINELRQLIE